MPNYVLKSSSLRGLHKWLFLPTLALACSVLIAACQTEAPPSSRLPRLRLGINSAAVASTLPLVADDLRYWSADGLQVDLVGFAAGRLALEAVVGGSVDVATVAETPTTLMALQGIDLVVIATIAKSKFQAVARGDRGITNESDLRGKKIATFLGTSAEFYLDSLLESSGVDRADVDVVNLTPTDMISALKRGDVDAIVVWQPHSKIATQALRSESVDAIVFSSNDTTYIEHFNLVTKRAYATQNKDTLELLLKSLLRAADFTHASPESTRTIVARRISVDPALLASVWGDFHFDVNLERSLPELITRVSEWAVRRDFVSSPKGPRADTLLLPAYLRDVAPQNVRL